MHFKDFYMYPKKRKRNFKKKYKAEIIYKQCKKKFVSF